MEEVSWSLRDERIRFHEDDVLRKFCSFFRQKARILFFELHTHKWGKVSYAESEEICISYLLLFKQQLNPNPNEQNY